MTMKLREIMSGGIVGAFAHNSLLEAADKMREYNVGCVVVLTEGGRLQGILTDRDIVVKAIAAGLDPARTPVAHIMQTHVICGRPDMDLLEASGLMAFHHIRRLPVEEEGRLIGIVSLTDLGRVAQRELDNLLAVRSAAMVH
jgi:CBS domain-containing protein